MNDVATSPPAPVEYVVNRFRSSMIVPDPFPHYYLEDIFPGDYYRSLLSHLPESSVYQNLYDVTDLKLDHFRHRFQRDLDEAWTDLLPDEIRGFWIDFNQWFMGARLAQTVLNTFAEPLREQFGGRPLPDVSVEAQLIRHRAGYFLGPHSDLYSKLLVVLFYLPPDETARHLGTSIYRPKDPGFSCPNSVHYSFDDFIRVETAPYKPNSLLAFLRSDRSFHGLEPLSEQDVSTGNRDLIQYVLYDKKLRDEQLRSRRHALGKEAAK